MGDPVHTNHKRGKGVLCHPARLIPNAEVKVTDLSWRAVRPFSEDGRCCMKASPAPESALMEDTTLIAQKRGGRCLRDLKSSILPRVESIDHFGEPR